jgi:hypothetical protein
MRQGLKAFALFVAIGVTVPIIATVVNGASDEYNKRAAEVAVYEHNRDNETQFEKVEAQVAKWRNDDFDHYCFEPMNKSLDQLTDGSRYVSTAEFEARKAVILKAWGGECSARNGWDNFEAKDFQAQYNQVMKTKIRSQWFGDKAWLETKLNEYYH